MRKTVMGFIVNDKFICEEHAKGNEVPRKAGFIPWQESPRQAWFLRPQSECIRCAAETKKKRTG